MEKIKTKIKFRIFKKLILLGSLLSVFLFSQIAQAASLYPSPSSGSYNVGQSFSVVVYVSSADQPMNAVSGVLNFPSDKLEVTALSKSGSVVSLWVQEPSFSNTSGMVNFEGIVLNPGYTGSAGKVLTVSFRTKGSGNAPLTFSSGSVLANDGQGTNILSGLGSASFAIEVPTSGPVAEQGETPTVTVGTLSAPQITSTTHSNPDSWYNTNIVEFNWALPNGANAVRLLVGEKPQVNPTVVYSPAISSRTLDPLEDGVWYFHVQLRNSAGWGGVTHFRFQIDTKNPENFSIEQQADEDFTNPTRKFYLDASDSISGIDYYEIQIDNGSPLEWHDDGSHIYQTPTLAPGRHTLIFKALDKAGNFLTSSAEFIIDPLELPLISDYPSSLTNKDPFIVKGQTYPNSQVVVWLQREATEPQSYIIKSATDGKFVFLAEEKLRDGVYTMWAEVVDSRGARSEPTDKLTILVEPTKLWQFGNLTISVLSVIIPSLALLLFLAGLVWYGLHKFKLLRRRIRVEAKEAEQVLHSEFALLKKRLKTHVKELEKASKKRALTKEEKKAVEQFKQDLDYVEQKVRKEIKDIEDQVR
ncbi:MAG: hypothetical protein Q8O32_00010 [bacterium]|nr:hypothetical protein [bacterium]